MVLPLLIHDLQHDVAFDALQHLAADHLLLFVVRLQNLRPQRIPDFIRGAIAEV